MKLKEINEKQIELVYQKEKLLQRLNEINAELSNLRKRKRECGVL